MRTPLEALFDAMITDGWANESSGDVESPTGHFARISNAPNEVSEVLDAFEDVIETYGQPDTIVGHYLVVTNDQGFITIYRFKNESELIRNYRDLEAQYGEWSSVSF
jgi:hypothetical protein